MLSRRGLMGLLVALSLAATPATAQYRWDELSFSSFGEDFYLSTVGGPIQVEMTKSPSLECVGLPGYSDPSVPQEVAEGASTLVSGPAEISVRVFLDGRYEDAVAGLEAPVVAEDLVARYVLGCIMEGLARARFQGPRSLETSPHPQKDDIQRAIAKSRTLGGQPKRALAWIEAAAASGIESAQWELARRWSNTQLRYSPFVAVDWMRRLAAKGDARAMVLLGHFYRAGHRVPVDEDEAFRLVSASASAGDTLGMKVLAQFYRRGISTDPDEVASVKWLQAAAERKDAEARYLLGLAFADGRGVPRAPASAAQWFRAAANGGSASAAYALSQMYRAGDGLDPDPDRAARYFAQALAAKNCSALMDDIERRAAANEIGKAAEEIDKALNPLSDCESWRYSRSSLDVMDHERSPADQARLDARLRKIRAELRGSPADLRETLAKLTSPNERTAASGVTDLIALARRLTDDPDGPADRASGSNSEEALAILAFPASWLPKSALAQIDSPYWQSRIALLRPLERETVTNYLLDSRHTRTDMRAILTIIREVDGGPGGRGEIEFLGRLGLQPAAMEAALDRLDRGEDPKEVSLDLVMLTHSCTTAPLFSKWITPMRGYTRDCGGLTTMDSLSIRQVERLKKHDFIGPLYEGMAYLEGRGAEPDPVRALALLESSEPGFVGKAIAGTVYEEGRGIAPDPKRAVEAYSNLLATLIAPLASDEPGSGAVATRLGLMLLEGLGAPVNAPQAVEYLRHGVRFGAARAEVGLADALLLGLGVPADPNEALRWYRQAAVDEPGALVRLGFLAATGRWNERKLGAQRWYALAARTGTSAAYLDLARAAAYAPSPRPAEIVHWLIKAARQQNGWAVRWLNACPDRSAECFRSQPGFRRQFFAGLVASGKRARPMLQAARPTERGSSDILQREAGHLRRQLDAVSARGAGWQDALPLLEKLERVQTYHGDAEGAIATRLRTVLAQDRMLARDRGSFGNYFAAVQSSCHWGLASKLAHGFGRKQAALLLAKIAVNRLQQARAYLADFDADVRECFVDLHKDRYRWLADLLIEADRLAEAETVLGLLKDFEQANDAHDPVRRRASGTDIALTEPEAASAALLQGIAAATGPTGEAETRRYSASADVVASTVLLDEDPHFQQDLDAFTRTVAALDLKKGDPDSTDRVQRLRDIRPKLVADLGERFPKGTATLHAVVLSTRLRWILASAQGRKSITIDVSQADLENAVGKLREAILTESPTVQEPAQELYRMVFASIDRELARRGIKTVMLSLDRRLRYLPFAALHDGSGWLVQRYSFTSFRHPDDYLRSKRGLPWKIAAFAATGPEGAVDSLPAAGLEVDDIVRTGADDIGILEGERLVNGAFTRNALVAALKADFRVVHIASHFVLDHTRADGSYLMLGDGTKLPLLDVKNDSAFTFKHVDLVTLSACQTGLGGHYGDGSEVDSLGTIAQEAGAPAVIASLWSVKDASTARLMVQFYSKRVAGRSLAESLRAVQVEMIAGAGSGNSQAAASRDYAHPFYWAPFIVIGNWQ